MVDTTMVDKATIVLFDAFHAVVAFLCVTDWELHPPVQVNLESLSMSHLSMRHLFMSHSSVSHLSLSHLSMSHLSMSHLSTSHWSMCAPLGLLLVVEGFVMTACGCRGFSFFC